jgi:hypothetical protein
MAGETELGRLIAALDPVVRPGAYVVVTRPGLEVASADAIIREDEGVTHVLPRATADARGWTYDFVAAWVTLRVRSSLAAVGLTAAVARVLAEAGISCNVLAAFHHDHLLVPIDRVGDALAALGRLAAGETAEPAIEGPERTPTEPLPCVCAPPGSAALRSASSTRTRWSGR